MKIKTVKLITLLAVSAAIAIAGWLFREQRMFKEPVVASGNIYAVKKLSDYSQSVKGTINDVNVYIFDSGVPGGTLLLIGGTHAEEPAANVSAQVFTENLKVSAGKVIIIHRINASASTTTRLGEAYPRFFHVTTPWGIKQWRFGDRVASPLDSWPDPEVYVHYPSGQNLAYMDIRNVNRNWPGRPNGLITERTTYAVMRLIEAEGVNLTIDFHEAELEYPVENTIVTHQEGNEIAAMTSMMLTAQTFDVPIGMEFSPKELHGLSHREIGDHSDAVSYLIEVAEPMLDRIRGITDEELLMSGKDRFVMIAGEHKLLYAPIDEEGWPFDKRVARHVTAAATLVQVHNMMRPDQTILMEGIPSYQDIIDNGTGYYLHDPATSSQEFVFYD